MRPLISMRMKNPEEVLLSYYCGLAPVGESFVFSLPDLMADLGLLYRVYYYKLLSRLIELGAVQRLSAGSSRKAGLMVVLKRPEDVAFPESWRGRAQRTTFRPSFNPALVKRRAEAKLAANVLLPMPRWAADIVRGVAVRHGISPLDVIGPSRKRRVSKARNEAAYLLLSRRSNRSFSNRGTVSLNIVGKWLNRHHATIIHSVQQHATEHGLPQLTASTANRGAYAISRLAA